MSYQQPTHYTPPQAPYPQMSMPPQPQVYLNAHPRHGHNNIHILHILPITIYIPNQHAYTHATPMLLSTWGAHTIVLCPEPTSTSIGKQLPQVQQQQYTSYNSHNYNNNTSNNNINKQAQPHIQFAQQQHEQPHYEHLQLTTHTYVQQPEEGEQQQDLPAPHGNPKPARLDVVHSKILESAKIDEMEMLGCIQVSGSPSLDHVREKETTFCLRWASVK